MLTLVQWTLYFGIARLVFSSYVEIQCSWKGSGLSLEAGSVEQVSLNCPKGSVEWLYPAGALRFSFLPLQHLTSPGSVSRHLIGCIKPALGFRGAELYLEREGTLELLLTEDDQTSPSRVHCFTWLPSQKVALFLQATPQQDISRHISGFHYEVRGDWIENLALPLNKWNNEVVQGSIRTIVHDVELRESVIGISATRILRQKFALFHTRGHAMKPLGNIRTPLNCGVKPGPGSFVFMGWVHFGDAWLDCAPRYKDFVQVYEAATQAHTNPCKIALD
ncbi:hypothetical protein GDO86_018215 [Hymenochirus boettgeri]|uniref:Meteorin n=1 Tax=Hymenochirus boettgeri TaxID=247094 RepID=A0A8T2IPC1_9PIPI|nr:hypothetical protein GDO86_018215 [Hymenochirus boettgeri]